MFGLIRGGSSVTGALPRGFIWDCPIAALNASGTDPHGGRMIDTSGIFGRPDACEADRRDLARASQKIMELLVRAGVGVSLHSWQAGPTLTRYNYVPDSPTVNLERLRSLQDNLALLLAVRSVRVLAPVPSRPFVGVEVPNAVRRTVVMRDILGGKKSQEGKNMELPVTMGLTIEGKKFTADLAGMPHLLVAGATGSGKSVFINSLIICLASRLAPTELNLVLIDPKMVELGVYSGLPHLIQPIVTHPSAAIAALSGLEAVMRERYTRLQETYSRSLAAYNQANPGGGLPYIVCVIDEFADIAAYDRRALDDVLSKLAAMGRATGMHLVLATQRPSVDVVTGVIKNNFPSRASFRVPSAVDSRVILDDAGAESLLGDGDMLYRSPASDALERLQGAYASDAEVQRFVDAAGDAYPPADRSGLPESDAGFDDETVRTARELADAYENHTAPFLQRQFRISLARARELSEIISKK